MSDSIHDPRLRRAPSPRARTRTSSTSQGDLSESLTESWTETTPDRSASAWVRARRATAKLAAAKRLSRTTLRQVRSPGRFGIPDEALEALRDDAVAGLEERIEAALELLHKYPNNERVVEKATHYLATALTDDMDLAAETRRWRRAVDWLRSEEAAQPAASQALAALASYEPAEPSVASEEFEFEDSMASSGTLEGFVSPFEVEVVREELREELGRDLRRDVAEHDVRAFPTDVGDLILQYGDADRTLLHQYAGRYAPDAQGRATLSTDIHGAITLGQAAVFRGLESMRSEPFHRRSIFGTAASTLALTTATLAGGLVGLARYAVNKPLERLRRR